VTPDATTTFSIPENHLYRPISVSPETVTAWLYRHHNNPASNSRLQKLVGGAANFNLSVTPRALVPINFTLTGLLPGNPTDVAKPSDPTFQSTGPEPYISALSYLGDVALKFSEFSFDLGNGVQQFDDPAAVYGFDVGAVLSRRSTGRIVPEQSLISARDSFADWTSSTSRGLWLRWGSAAGKRVSLLFPEVRFTGYAPADVRGFGAEALNFQSVQSDGEVWMCLH